MKPAYADTAIDRSNLAEQYAAVRSFSELIAEPLSPEDCAIQSMPDASPTRWHLAHTTWFFETFLLKSLSGYKCFDPNFEALFNSYYNAIGSQFPRDRRGLISRPGLEETLAYRQHVDQAMRAWLQTDTVEPTQREVLRIGLNHEQQHQELMFTDIKHALSCNPLAPCYRRDPAAAACSDEHELSWVELDEELVWIGSDSKDFAFDNEQPRHRFFLTPYHLASRCVSNAEYLAFIEDGGYCRPELWLSMGWNTIQAYGWQAPLYWHRDEQGWSQFTLAGRKPLVDAEPVCHVSFFEADAYARWSGHRLPTEQEWENAVRYTFGMPDANQVNSLAGHWSNVLLANGHAVHPQVHKGDAESSNLVNAVGNLWQWTASQYRPYPGYRAPAGALGEYNGKFMCNQFVLRGGSCATPSGHIRLTYRNFFPPETRWQFSGIRLAR